MQNTCEILIVGGGVMGMSTAFWLSRAGVRDIVVVEPDPTLARSATALSAASIRMQFSTRVNVELSRYGLEFIRTYRSMLDVPDLPASLGFRENGYLFLSGSPDTEAAMRESVAVQHAAGAKTQLLAPTEVSDQFPHLQVDDVRLASYGAMDEGWFDNIGLHEVFRRAALHGGVRTIRDTVVGFETAASGGGPRVVSAKLESGERLAPCTVINAAGTGAGTMMRLLGEDLPVEPRKRTVFVLKAPDALFPGAPLTIDHTGIWFRPEGEFWLAATIPDDDGPADPADFEPDWALFEDAIWEKLYHRCTAFGAVRIVRAWAGHYEYNTLDQNGVIGRWPTIENLYVIGGFSGHGLQQAAAAGRGLSEQVVLGAFQNIDLSELSPERILRNAPFRERAVV